MQKLSIQNAKLSCFLQQDTEISQNKCYTGIISKVDDGLRFEETIRKGRGPCCPKLYDGKYITLVRKSNGKYQIYTKTLHLKPDFLVTKVAAEFYQDVANALTLIH